MKNLVFKYKQKSLTIVVLIIFLLIPFTTVLADNNSWYEHWEDVTDAWTHNGMNAGDGNYAETEVVPHWVGWDGLTPTTVTYGFVLSYDYRQGSDTACGFDHLAQYNTSRQPPWNGTGTGLEPELNGPLTGGDGDLYTYGVQVGSVTISPAIYTGGSGDLIAHHEVTYIASGPVAEFYFGLYLAGDEDCGPGIPGVASYTGASLRTYMDPHPGTGDIVPNAGRGRLPMDPSGVLQTDISGIKWFDINGNTYGPVSRPDGIGGWTPVEAEPVMENWTIYLNQCTDTTPPIPPADCTGWTMDSPVQTDLTDLNGRYVFTELTIGTTYQVCEDPDGPNGDPKWKQTWPLSTPYGGCSPPIAITEGANTEYQDFGNWYGKTAVTLTNYTASPQNINIAVLVEWQTIMQTDTLGFNLYRSLAENGTRELLGYIPVKIPNGGVAEYEYLDDEVLPGKTYYYWLEAVDINGSSEVFDPVAAAWWWKSYIPMITR